MSAKLTAKTLELTRSFGWESDVTERWIPIKAHPGGGVRRDLFGCIDVVCITPHGILGIQSTGATNHSEHLRKMREEPRLKQWLRAGAFFVLWSWKKPETRWLVKAQGFDQGTAQAMAPTKFVLPLATQAAYLSGIPGA